MNENLNENNNVTPPVNETVVETPVTGPTITVPLEPKKKKKGGFLKGLIIFLIVVLIIGGLIFGGIKLYKHLTTIEDPFPDIDSYGAVTGDNNYDPTNSFVKHIEFDYANGYINTDQYLMQLAYSIYEPSKVDEKYSSLENDYLNPRDLFEKYGEHQDNISDETAMYILGKFFLDNITIGTSNNSEDNTTGSIYNYQVQRTFMGNEIGGDYWFEQSPLTKVQLTSGKHFLIYYSETGNNAISGEKVTEIGNHLEKVVKEYKKNYGLDFKYHNYLTDGLLGEEKMTLPNSQGASQLLKENNIDEKYLSSAMPVYLVDLETDNAPAFYYPSQFIYGVAADTMTRLLSQYVILCRGHLNGSVSDRMKVELTAGTYASPYFVINSSEPNIANSKLFAAHELFHHYQNYVCGEGDYKACPSGLFTIETTANVASIQNSGIDEAGTSLTNHAWWYSKLTEENINTIGQGYGGFVFLSNYTEIVPNGKNIAVQSVKYKDALSYIYNNSSGKYKDAFLLTAERLLTFDYKYKQLMPYEKGNSWSASYPKAHNDITANSNHEAINYSSIHYYYVDPSTLGENKISFQAGTDTEHEMTLLLFVKENNKYKKVYSHNLDKKFVIKASDWTDYDEIAFAIVESSIYNNDAYYILETSPNIKDDVTVTPKSLGLKEPDQSKRKANTIMCYQIEDNEYFKTGYQVLINLDKDQNIDNMLMKGTLKVKDNVVATKAFDIAKKTAPGLLLAMRLKYQQMLKNVRITTSETDDSWTILFKVTKDYDGAFTSTFGAAGNSKEEIINTIKAKGFTCE